MGIFRNRYSKGAEVALSGLKCPNLESKTVAILGYHYSYNKKIKKE